MPDKTEPRDHIQFYRQPMVTATGILLGFMLNFAVEWAPKKSSWSSSRDILILLGVTSSVVLLTVVMYRILNMKYPKEGVQNYYHTTLLILIAGLSCIFLSLMAVKLQSFI